MAIDLKKLEKKVTEVLAKETPESLAKWFTEQREKEKNKYKFNYGDLVKYTEEFKKRVETDPKVFNEEYVLKDLVGIVEYSNSKLSGFTLVQVVFNAGSENYHVMSFDEDNLEHAHTLTSEWIEVENPLITPYNYEFIENTVLRYPQERCSVRNDGTKIGSNYCKGTCEYAVGHGDKYILCTRIKEATNT